MLIPNFCADLYDFSIIKPDKETEIYFNNQPIEFYLIF